MYLKDGPNVNQLQYECCLDLTYILTWDGTPTSPPYSGTPPGWWVSPITLTWDGTNWKYFIDTGTYWNDVEWSIHCHGDSWGLLGYYDADEARRILLATLLGGVTPVGTYSGTIPTGTSNYQISLAP